MDAGQSELWTTLKQTTNDYNYRRAVNKMDALELRNRVQFWIDETITA